MRVFDNNRFSQGILVCIVLNTLLLAIEFDGMPGPMVVTLWWCNLTFSIIFAAEFVLKLAGLGVRGYFEDGFNVFDGFVVFMSILELSLENSNLSAIK